MKSFFYPSSVVVKAHICSVSSYKELEGTFCRCLFWVPCENEKIHLLVTYLTGHNWTPALSPRSIDLFYWTLGCNDYSSQAFSHRSFLDPRISRSWVDSLAYHFITSWPSFWKPNCALQDRVKDFPENAEVERTGRQRIRTLVWRNDQKLHPDAARQWEPGIAKHQHIPLSNILPVMVVPCG